MTITLTMFIELTDHLRCPADHDESFLVLLPDSMEGRSVRTGQLGCPVCGRTFQLADGVFDTGDAPRAGCGSGSALDADALTALVGLSGPGGYLALVGPVLRSGARSPSCNPGSGAGGGQSAGPEVTDAPEISVIRGGRIPIKSDRCGAWCWAGPSPTIPTGSRKRRGWCCRACG